MSASVNTGIDPFAQVITGGILATLGSAFGAFVAKLVLDHRERRNIEAALAAEIRSVLRLAESTEYRSALTDVVEYHEQHNEIPPFPVAFRSTYSTVFAGCSQKLGLICPPVLRDLVRFYYEMQALIEQNDMLKCCSDDCIARKLTKDAKELEFHRKLVAAMLAQTDSVLEQARNLINVLDPPNDRDLGEC